MSEEEQSGAGEKSHEATAEKLRKTRKQGDVPYSPEATTAATYIGFFLACILFAGWSASRLVTQLTAFFDKPQDFVRLLLHSQGEGALAQVISGILFSLGPLFLMLILCIALSVVAQQAFVFAPSKIKPKFSKLSVVKNAKQKFGPDGIAEFVRSFAKLSAVLAILLFAFKDRFFGLSSLTGTPAQSVGTHLLRDTIFLTGLVTAAALFIAMIDLPWRHFRYKGRLKMTHQEVKEESKETEGDPHLKSARRGRAEAIATNQMLLDVPKADIVIVNPTHYAVALKWERDKQRAPTCVAKGVDEVAAKIRESASLAGVPIKRDPPTARSIHALVKVGEEIRKEHYAAVAAAIHYADTIRKKPKSTDLT